MNREEEMIELCLELVFCLADIDDSKAMKIIKKTEKKCIERNIANGDCHSFLKAFYDISRKIRENRLANPPV